jgi:hypothetical protein
MIARRIWIRGHLATVTGDVTYAEPDGGIVNDRFTATHIRFDDRGELEAHEELTDGEMDEIDRAYWEGKPFDNYEHTVLFETPQLTAHMVTAEDLRAAEDCIAGAVADLGDVTGKILPLLEDNFEWSLAKCEAVAWYCARNNVPTRVLCKTRLVLFSDYATLACYDVETATFLTEAVSEIYPYSYIYTRTWANETNEQYSARRRKQIWG